MEKRLIFTATSPASGDSTTWFDVTSNKKLTLEELVNAIITENPGEWGQVERWIHSTADSPFKVEVYVEYQDGKITKTYPEYEQYKDKIIKRLTANGGWSSMNYYIGKFEHEK